MKLLRLLAFFGVGIAGIGGWYGFSGLRPKNLQQYLEWQGFELASKKRGNTWKAILDEHKSIVVSRTGKSNPTETDIENWCSNNLSVKDYDSLKEDASKICVDNPQTVRAKIIQQDGDIKALIQDTDSSKEDKYKVSYIFRKHISGVSTLIGFIPPPQEEGQPPKEGIDDGGKALQAWCEKSLNEKPDDSLVSNVRLLCSPKKFTTIQELIKERGEEKLLLTDSDNASELAQKYKDIEKLDSWNKDESKVSAHAKQEDLKNWCETYEKKKFSEEGTFSNVYPKFRFRCMKSLNNPSSNTQ